MKRREESGGGKKREFGMEDGWVEEKGGFDWESVCLSGALIE